MRTISEGTKRKERIKNYTLKKCQGKKTDKKFGGKIKNI